VYSKPDALTVFLPTSTHIYIGVAKDSYSSDAALGGLAQAAFNGRAVSLARGTDYFDSSLDLHKAFGKAFFGDPLRSDSSADPITIRSLSWLDDRWEIVVEGEKDLGVITLAADFEIRDFVRMVR
jgi:hypothetical protein